MEDFLIEWMWVWIYGCAAVIAGYLVFGVLSTLRRRKYW